MRGAALPDLLWGSFVSIFQIWLTDHSKWTIIDIIYEDFPLESVPFCSCGFEVIS